MDIDKLQRQAAIHNAVYLRCLKEKLSSDAAYQGANFAVECYWAEDEESASRAIEMGVIHARYRNTVRG
jgi:hypothetical protein